MVYSYRNYKLKIEIDLLHVLHIFWFLIIYFGVTGVLLTLGYFFKEEIDATIDYYVVSNIQFFCFYLKQYLILQEVERSMQELKLINLEIIRSELEIKRLQKEIVTLQDSSENLKKMLLPDSTEVEAKLAERRKATQLDQSLRRNSFWATVVAALVFEAVVLWKNW